MSVPYVEPMRNTTYSDSPDGESKGDLIVNNLMYRQPKALSLAKSRTHVRQFFQRSDYESAPGKTAICDWNTGASYINVDNRNRREIGAKSSIRFAKRLSRLPAI